MAAALPCPFLGKEVELTAWRKDRILQKHPEAFPLGIARLGGVLLEPDCVRLSVRDPEVLLISRWYDDLLMGKHLVVVVGTRASNEERPRILTAYAARDLGPGEVLWRRS